MKQRTKKYVLVGIAAGFIALIPLWMTLWTLFDILILDDIIYPAWDFACDHDITIENYSSYDKENLVKIADNAIKQEYLDINIPDDVVWSSDEFNSLSVLYLDSDSPWNVVIDALEKNGIKAEFGGTGCA